jgi:hypothetical protein
MGKLDGKVALLTLTARGEAELRRTADELAAAGTRVLSPLATLSPHVNLLEAIVLPIGQLYIGRG